ncbi:hypothetical protein AGMMS50222_02610 [Endomicrobiia bacterium]|nr:hypothetical protein AGMMS49531_01400 [Endomicrobiia bacterium]GHT64534.1 hypothetical protein AGMMS49556_02790 [Endomicrobiia bacterium]GHT70757.1 hypothetical protein AGMMS49950_06280 [Endomicrobiia bacterium]GHT74078.1 hypothetical protein AGMMS50222_02610 [Endomicrobiia bacterium]
MTDINAVLIVAFIAIPLSITFGIASGVVPGKGLVIAVIAGFLISLLAVAVYRLEGLRGLL